MILVREEATAVGSRHVKNFHAAAAHTTLAAFFCIEMVVSRRAGNDLAVFGHAKAFCIRFVGLHS